MKILSAKEKAAELIKKYEVEINLFTGGQEGHSKIMAARLSAICVDEILQIEIFSFGSNTPTVKFWQQVKVELKSKRT